MIVERGGWGQPTTLLVHPAWAPEAENLKTRLIRHLQRDIMEREWSRWAEYDDSMQVKI